MKNKLADLNNHLFSQLERLSDENLTAEQIEQEADRGVAMIVRTAFLESVGRYENLFKLNPPTIVAQFTERVPMVKGRLTAKGSTATAYCWLVWIKGEKPRPFQWIPPCRKKLERDGDYPVEAAIA